MSQFLRHRHEDFKTFFHIYIKLYCMFLFSSYLQIWSSLTTFSLLLLFITIQYSITVCMYTWVLVSEQIWDLGIRTSSDRICWESESLKVRGRCLGIWIRKRGIQVWILRTGVGVSVRIEFVRIANDLRGVSVSKQFGYRDLSVQRGNFYDKKWPKLFL